MDLIWIFSEKKVSCIWYACTYYYYGSNEGTFNLFKIGFNPSVINRVTRIKSIQTNPQKDLQGKVILGLVKLLIDHYPVIWGSSYIELWNQTYFNAFHSLYYFTYHHVLLSLHSCYMFSSRD